MKKIILVLKEDIIEYPPVISILNVLSETSHEIYFLGTYSDAKGKRDLEKKGIRFVDMPPYEGKANKLKKMMLQIEFRKQVMNGLSKIQLSKDDVLWLIQAETIYLLSSLVKKYKTICHFLEFADNKVDWKYRLLNPRLNLADTLQHAYRVVCCEYNRAQIAKGIFQLDRLPVVLPNKMVINEDRNIPDDVAKIIGELKERLDGKKIILYQGIFLDKERRLEEFCEAMGDLPDDYVFIAMGKGSEMYERLRKQYASDRILFIPFIRPPYHLQVTKMASIGVLSYFPRKGSIGRTLNPIYCAPNKIFEYARFGVPMISNDIPGLKYTYIEFHCGKCVDYPMNKNQIVNTIKSVMDNYLSYKKGAIKFYNSVDIQSIILNEIL